MAQKVIRRVIADICSGFDLSIKEVLGQRQTWHVVTSQIEVANPGLLAKEAGFLKLHTGRDVKVAIPSPYLIGERMWDPELSKAAYPTRRDFTEALVPVLRQELKALRDEGVAVAQFDDPHLCLFVDPKVRADYDDPQAEMAYCVDLLNRVVEGVDGVRLALHLCRRNKGRAGWVGGGGIRADSSSLGRSQGRYSHVGVCDTGGGRLRCIARHTGTLRYRSGMRRLPQQPHRHAGRDCRPRQAGCPIRRA